MTGPDGRPLRDMHGNQIVVNAHGHAIDKQGNVLANPPVIMQDGVVFSGGGAPGAGAPSFPAAEGRDLSSAAGKEATFSRPQQTLAIMLKNFHIQRKQKKANMCRCCCMACCLCCGILLAVVFGGAAGLLIVSKNISLEKYERDHLLLPRSLGGVSASLWRQLLYPDPKTGPILTPARVDADGGGDAGYAAYAAAKQNWQDSADVLLMTTSMMGGASWERDEQRYSNYEITNS